MSIEDLLQETLDERAARVLTDDELAQKVVRRARSRHGRQVLVALSALVIVVVVVILTLNQALPHTSKIRPDPRGTAAPSASSASPHASIPGVSTTYRIFQGPVPTPPSGGAPIAVTPRVERRAATTWLVTPTVSVALPTTVNQARGIQQAGSSWVVLTISTGYTGGDTDPGAQILVVSTNGAVRSLLTGSVRSLAVSLDGTQVASVETVETASTWSVDLVVRRLADGGVMRRVALPYGQPGEWPYSALAWTPQGIVASNQSGAITAAGATVLVQGDAVTDEAPITGIYRAPASSDLYVTSASSGSTCLGYAPKTTPAPATATRILCGHLGAVTPLENGRVLVRLAEGDGSQAVLADTVAGTLTLLTLPPVVKAGYFYPDAQASVLVNDIGNKVWWRWSLLANSVETAALPVGTNAAIGW